MKKDTNAAGQTLPLDSLVGLLESAQKLNEIVEGLRSVRWNHEGSRLKDTNEWCEFYVSLKRAERDRANAGLTGTAVVFRIQDADGRGPWKPGFSHQWVEDRPDHENLPPWFVEFGRVDKLAPAGEHVGSGCRTLEQLRRWFTPTEYATLRRFGYRAVRMVVGRLLAESDRQCVFGRARPLRDGAEPVELYEHDEGLNGTAQEPA